MAARVTTLVAGDTWRRTWTLTDEAGDIIDLTGASARLHLRDSAGILAASATTGVDARLTMTVETGQIAMDMPASATVDLAAGGHLFALEVTLSDGTVATVETAALAVLQDITHDEA